MALFRRWLGETALCCAVARGQKQKRSRVRTLGVGRRTDAGFHICILGRHERVCHADEREKVAVTAGHKTGPGHMKGHSQQEMRLEGEVNILYGGGEGGTP